MVASSLPLSANDVCFRRVGLVFSLGFADELTDFTVTLQQVHKLCQTAAANILDVFQPNLMIAIGGGGYVPARIIRYVSQGTVAHSNNIA